MVPKRGTLMEFETLVLGKNTVLYQCHQCYAVTANKEGHEHWHITLHTEVNGDFDE